MWILFLSFGAASDSRQQPQAITDPQMVGVKGHPTAGGNSCGQRPSDDGPGRVEQRVGADDRGVHEHRGGPGNG